MGEGRGEGGLKGSESERGERGFDGKGRCMSGGGEYG